MKNFVTVIGTVFVDCKGFAKQNYIPQGRNLGNIEFVHGGVGRNVAENLANLELNTAFVSTMDHSGLGLEIKQRLQDVQVNTDFLKPANQGMGMWLAVLDENGDLAGSISQMPDLKALESVFAESIQEIVERSSHIALELDLNEQISSSVISMAVQQNKPVYGIPGNLDVVLKNRGLLKQLECFICNEVEAERLFDKSIGTTNPDEMLQELVPFVDAVGLRSMVITLGEHGSVYYDSVTKEQGHQPVFPVKVVDSSGAGDAFFSGTIMGLVRGMSLKESVVCGTKVAGWTIESQENNCPDLKVRTGKDEYFQRLLVK
ncbi:carbohydrate kinase family protein [Paenibacillus sp. FSL H7-0331]|uniref:carbohydrate kinase family protein n=1 Tax=Paenibacillus sp. FSL H7-0331 TaxID=1920421 RepID=UPI00096D30B6|nr:PfkB family carbohydrate kinase [Paenibacillus sp. FSL H7-0331]OMF20805.1 sugar kinase [Paenibacillus sp. FSL H7-0331]